MADDVSESVRGHWRVPVTWSGTDTSDVVSLNHAKIVSWQTPDDAAFTGVLTITPRLQPGDTGVQANDGEGNSGLAVTCVRNERTTVTDPAKVMQLASYSNLVFVLPSGTYTSPEPSDFVLELN